MEVTRNGRPHTLPDGSDVASLVTELTDDPRGLAVAVNGMVVRRTDWETTVLREGDRVEIVGASQGG